MLQLALLAFLASFICYFVQWTFGQPMIDQPICVGLVAGLIFGDVTTGIIIGAAMEAIFIGNVNVGGATSAEPVTGTVMAVCFVTHMGMDQGAAITLATAVAIFANIIYSLIFNVLMSFWAPLIDWAADTGETKNVFIVHFGGALVMNAAMAIPTFLGVYFGAEPVANLVNVIPAAVTNGFNAAAGLLPAVGMALLLRMLWNNKTAIYFLLGFVLVSYLGMPMVGVAAIGAVVVVVTAYREMDLMDLRNKIKSLRETGVAAGTLSKAEVEEEDFFA
ncbi:MAG: PTS mannose/fructose/sorbose/N-acetylgalactosamine transporter subunit IIC [Tractidigestivibacter sp.]|jgi:PTS system mannose-specific IIC component|uniref:PTS mannose/fructose/sorbose/N-acetylgalactosamine transporter subunit IIC n=1 Tax=Tractidigestivibacter sp. TaxID=2847320 RepID=UPI003D8DD5CE